MSDIATWTGVATDGGGRANGSGALGEKNVVSGERLKSGVDGPDDLKASKSERETPSGSVGGYEVRIRFGVDGL